MDDQTLAIAVRWRRDYPAEYTTRQKEQARDDLARELFKFLYRPGFESRHTVIHLSEEEQPWDYNSMDYRLWVEVTEAQYQHIVFPILPEYSTYKWGQLSSSALDEIKHRVHKFFNTVRVKPG